MRKNSSPARPGGIFARLQSPGKPVPEGDARSWCGAAPPGGSARISRRSSNPAGLGEIRIALDGTRAAVLERQVRERAQLFHHGRDPRRRGTRSHIRHGLVHYRLDWRQGEVLSRRRACCGRRGLLRTRAQEGRRIRREDTADELHERSRGETPPASWSWTNDSTFNHHEAAAIPRKVQGSNNLRKDSAREQPSRSEAPSSRGQPDDLSGCHASSRPGGTPRQRPPRGNQETPTLKRPVLTPTPSSLVTDSSPIFSVLNSPVV